MKRVTDLIGAISATAAEQSDGIDQFSQAITDIDFVTQLNAALVKQSAATSSTNEQSEQ